MFEGEWRKLRIRCGEEMGNEMRGSRRRGGKEGRWVREERMTERRLEGRGERYGGGDFN